MGAGRLFEATPSLNPSRQGREVLSSPLTGEAGWGCSMVNKRLFGDLLR
jgi:hypothetical protein